MRIGAFTYIVTNRPRGTLYVGVTSDLETRLYQHQNHLISGFTSKYNLTKLVWFLAGDDIRGAIALEKKIKNRGREWKINLIERENPEWEDLSEAWT